MCLPFSSCELCQRQLLLNYVTLNKAKRTTSYYYFCNPDCRSEFILRSNQRISTLIPTAKASGRYENSHHHHKHHKNFNYYEL